jgi:hypothetical protein
MAEGHRLLLAAEAALWLGLAGLALRVTSFARLAAVAGRPLNGVRIDDGGRDAAQISWAVEAAARRAPWSALCFERGLAAHFMLRRRGWDSTLYYGARNDDSRGPSAHVWVRLRERNVIGVEEAPRFAELVRFPARPGGAH